MNWSQSCKLQTFTDVQNFIVSAYLGSSKKSASVFPALGEMFAFGLFFKEYNFDAYNGYSSFLALLKQSKRYF